MSESLTNQMAHAIANLEGKVAKLQAENAELVALLREMHHVLASETGFMQAVRGDSGKTYPWEPWEQLEPRIDAYLKEHGHE